MEVWRVKLNMELVVLSFEKGKRRWCLNKLYFSEERFECGG